MKGRSRIADTLNHFPKYASRVVLLDCLAGSGWVDGATTLGTATLEPWSIHQQITALASGAVVFTPASLTLPTTTPCELCQDACVLH